MPVLVVPWSFGFAAVLRGCAWTLDLGSLAVSANFNPQRWAHRSVFLGVDLGASALFCLSICLGNDSYLVDPASSHMLVSKIKPCMSKFTPSYGETANGSLNQSRFLR